MYVCIYLTVIKSEPHKSSSLKGQSVGHRQAPSSHLAPCSHFISRQRSKIRETHFNKMYRRYIHRHIDFHQVQIV